MAALVLADLYLQQKRNDILYAKEIQDKISMIVENQKNIEAIDKLP